jgi:hypothetical protein
MSLRKLNGYWTIFSGGQPVMSYPTFAAAWAAIWDICQERLT